MTPQTRLLRHLISEVRKSSSANKISQSNLIRYTLSQYRRFSVTDLQICRAADEMKCLANTYVTYLTSLRRYKELLTTYHKPGERSVKDTADLVGFKLPSDPK